MPAVSALLHDGEVKSYVDGGHEVALYGSRASRPVRSWSVFVSAQHGERTAVPPEASTRPAG
jgi:hypothetical protein